MSTENQDEKLNPQNYAKYDKPFMLFGSVMNALQGNLTPENWQEVADQVWNWAKTRVSAFVDELYINQQIPTIDEEEVEPEL